VIGYLTDPERWTILHVMSQLSYRINKFIQRLSATKARPEIRWHDVVRIEAMGTDAFSACQIWLTFTYSDGSEIQVFVEMKGYWDIVESLHTRFPSISPTWYEKMSEQPWHVESLLYSRDKNGG
jgi:hypothetical protein